MYVPPATGSDIRVWNAVIPPNCTVLRPRQHPAIQAAQKSTYMTSELTMLCRMMNTYQPTGIGGWGNAYTVSVERSTSANAGQYACIQARSGRSPLLQRPASQPPVIWKGKEMRTVSERSSFENPFSTIFSVDTAESAWKPILATSRRMRSVWTSTGWGERRQGEGRGGTHGAVS